MTIQPAPDADLVDRRYLSQFASEEVGLVLQDVTGPVDPDAMAVTATMTNEASGAVVFSRPAGRLDVGTYSVMLASEETAIPGPYTIDFAFTRGGVADHYALQFEVGSRAPDYDALAPGMKDIVEQVWIRFADLYDAPLGGPHLQIYMQTHFGRNRLAQLLKQAIGRLNAISQPHTTYTLDRPFPFDKWGPLLVQALYVEVVKHLRRSYVEIPEIVLGTSVSRGDRRDYMDRWGTILQEEQEDLRLMTDSFKMDHMGLGNVSVLVSGGAYGRYGPFAPLGGGTAAARGYFVARRF